MRDLSLHLIDILQNSITAGASEVELQVSVDSDKDELSLSIIDNGCGMEPEFLQRVTDPFVTTRTTRTVGLGLPLLQASAQMAGGELRIKSVKNCGTSVFATFQISHIDRIPLGSISETIVATVAAHPNLELKLILINPDRKFSLYTRDIKEQLEDVPINHFEVLSWLGSYVYEYEKAIFGGVLDEVDC